MQSPTSNLTPAGLSTADYQPLVAHVVIKSKAGEIELDRLCLQLRDHLHIDFMQSKYSFDAEEAANIQDETTAKTEL